MPAPSPAAPELNRFLKTLLAVTCLMVIGYVGLSVYAYYARLARAEAIAREQAALGPLRAKCAQARGLLAYYAAPKARQRPGQMSWDDARLFVQRNCSEEQLWPRAFRQPAYRDPLPPSRAGG